MVISITMVRVLPGKERFVYSSLKGKDGILDVYHTFGEYDFFIVIQSNGLCDLNRHLETIQERPDVISTRTILVGWDNGSRVMDPANPLMAI